MTFGPDNHIYVSDNTNSKIRKYNGTTGTPMGKTSTDAAWATTGGIPNGITWNNNTLYVATLKGIDRISSTGSNLGFFGDATRNPSTSGAPSLLSPYDVAFCNDGYMYVADKSLNDILYYSDSTGKYMGKVSEYTNPKPNTSYARGLHCDSILYQSGDDSGRVNEINYTTKKLVNQFTTLIDEPYGLDQDESGNLYVANKDDDNIIKISNGISSVFVDKLDDPRGITIGPKYTASSSSEGSSTMPDNDSPQISLQNTINDIVINANSITHLEITTTDPENDAIQLGLIPYAIPNNAVSLVDKNNGTGTITINTNNIKAGIYAFMLTASDGSNLERQEYTVIVK